MFRTALPDMTFISNGVTAGDRGRTVEWTSAQVRGASVIELDASGLIRACRDYWDAATWFRQLGLME